MMTISDCGNLQLFQIPLANANPLHVTRSFVPFQNLGLKDSGEASCRGKHQIRSLALMQHSEPCRVSLPANWAITYFYFHNSQPPESCTELLRVGDGTIFCWLTLFGVYQVACKNRGVNCCWPHGCSIYMLCFRFFCTTPLNYFRDKNPRSTLDPAVTQNFQYER